MSLTIDSITTILKNNTEFLQLPSGTTDQRPTTPAVGMTRYNTDIGYLEVYTNNGWKYLGFSDSAYGDSIFNTPSIIEQSWTVPQGVTSISVLCVGAGGSGSAPIDNDGAGGGGGGLAYVNNIPVTANTVCSYFVGGASFGNDGGNSYFKTPDGYIVCQANGGKKGIAGFDGAPGAGGTFSTMSGGGGGNGGTGGIKSGGGGGCGGYSGTGGTGGSGASSVEQSGSAGTGGAGGGGGSGGTNGGGGGGVGIYGIGSNGLGGSGATSSPWIGMQGRGGSGGSGGTYTMTGGVYGGGGGSTGVGASGVVRIMWGAGRNFPNNAPAI